MVTVMPAHQAPDLSGMLARVISIKQQGKKLAADERYMNEVEKPLKEAQAKYMNAMAAKMMDKDLENRQLALENRRVELDEKKFKATMKPIKELRKTLKDPNTLLDEKQLLRDAYLGIKRSEGMAQELDFLKTQAAVNNSITQRLGYELQKTTADREALSTSLAAAAGGLGYLSKTFGPKAVDTMLTEGYSKLLNLDVNPIPFETREARKGLIDTPVNWFADFFRDPLEGTPVDANSVRKPQ